MYNYGSRALFFVSLWSEVSDCSEHAFGNAMSFFSPQGRERNVVNLLLIIKHVLLLSVHIFADNICFLERNVCS